jgi:hypothetical protein
VSYSDVLRIDIVFTLPVHDVHAGIVMARRGEKETGVLRRVECGAGVGRNHDSSSWTREG